MSSEEKSILQSMTDEIRRNGKIHGWKAGDIKAKIAAVTALDKALEDVAYGYKKQPGAHKSHPLDFYKAIIVARLSEIPPRHRAIELQRVLPVIGLNEDWLKINGFSKGLFNARQLGKWIKSNVKGTEDQKDASKNKETPTEEAKIEMPASDQSGSKAGAPMSDREAMAEGANRSPQSADNTGRVQSSKSEYVPIMERRNQLNTQRPSGDKPR